MKNKITWGLIGTGNVTEVKSGPGLYKSSNSFLKGVFDVSFDKAKDWASRHGISKVYISIDEMLLDEDIDIVYIATPPNTHKEIVFKVLNAKKIPYVEKPMGLDFEECISMENLSKKLNIPIYVAFYRRAMEKYVKIKDLLDSKYIGEVLSVRVTHLMRVEDNELNPNKLPWRLIYEVTKGGKFLDMGVHVLDILTFFFGDIVNVNGIAKNYGNYYEVDDTVESIFEFENGVIGNGFWCYVSDRNVDEIIIYGTEGTITTEGLGYGDVFISKNGVDEVISFEVPEHVAMPYQQSIVNELLGIEKSNANTKSAINITKITDEILREYNCKFKERN